MMPESMQLVQFPVQVSLSVTAQLIPGWQNGALALAVFSPHWLRSLSMDAHDSLQRFSGA